MRFHTDKLTGTFGVVLTPAAAAQPVVAASELRPLLREHRAVLLRDFAIDVGVILELTRELFEGKMIYGQDRRQISACDTVQFTSPGRQWIQLHCEASYSPLRPDMALFYCDAPALKGGETHIGDGVSIYERLTPATQELLRTQRIRYYNLMKAPVWRRAFRVDTKDAMLQLLQSARPGRGDNQVVAFAIDAEETLRLDYVAPAVFRHPATGRFVFAASFTKYENDEPADWHLASGTRKVWTRFAAESPIPESVRREIDDALQACTVPVAWRKNDLLLLDNWSVLHGRAEFFDDVRSIFASFGYASWLRPEGVAPPLLVS